MTIEEYLKLTNEQVLSDATADWTPNYRPSNGTEGRMFESNWCQRCVHDHAAHMGELEKGCLIFAKSIAGDRPDEWEEAQVGGYFVARCRKFEADGCS